MVNSGIHIVEALAVLGRTLDGAGRVLAEDLQTKISRGHSLSAALQSSGHQISAVIPSLIHAGEKSGSLAQVLRLAADWVEVSANLQSKVKAALTYPAFVLGVNVVLTIGMLLTIVPAFEALYQDDQLPALTRFLLSATSLLSSKLFWLIAFLLTLEAVFFFLQEHSREKLLRFSLTLPVLSPLLRDAARAKYFSILSITSKAGTSTLECLRFASEASGDPHFKDLYPDLHDGIIAGEPLDAHFHCHREIYGALLVQAIAVGDETGNIDGISARMSEFFRFEAEYRLEQFKGLMEPMLIVLVSFTTASILLALYLPLVKFLQTLL